MKHKELSEENFEKKIFEENDFDCITIESTLEDSDTNPIFEAD